MEEAMNHWRSALEGRTCEESACLRRVFSLKMREGLFRAAFHRIQWYVVRQKAEGGHRMSSSKPLTTEQILSLLVEAPPRIAELTASLTAEQLQARPGRDEWSANEVLAHIRSCADVWGKCMATIIAEERPTLRAINPLTWIKQTNYLELDFRSSLHAFTTQRAELLAVLEPLPHASWSRAATVTGAGKALERTVQFYAQWLARHERTHVRQIEHLISGLRAR